MNEMVGPTTAEKVELGLCHGQGFGKAAPDTHWPSVDSTPLLVAKDRRTGMTFAAAVSMKGGGDPHAAQVRW